MEPDETSKQFEPIDPGSILRLEVIRLFLSNRYEDCEVVRCLDVKTGEACDVLFLPAMDPETEEIHMTPAFVIPESSLEDQESRYIPVNMLAKTNPANFRNN